MEIGPIHGLSRSGVLELCLKSVALEEGEVVERNVEYEIAGQ